MIKHPALARMLAVFLAINSLLALFAAALSFRRVEKDQNERLRQEELAVARFSEAEDLFAALSALQDEYDAIMQDYPQKQSREKKDSAEYRMSLGSHTATRAGLVLGREQLDAASAALKEAIRMYYVGLEAFEKGESAFLPVYKAYLGLRDGLNQGENLVTELRPQIDAARDADDPTLLSPDALLALSAFTRAQYAGLRDMLQGLQSSTPADQREFINALRQAAEQYNEIAPTLTDFNVDRLAYEASVSMYEQAQAAMDEAIASGADAEAARQAADAFCEARFGMRFDELGLWLESQEPESSGDGAETISPEMLEFVLDALPDDRSLIETAIGLVDGADQDLADKEAAFQADPQSMSAAQLLLAASDESLQSAERLIALVEPQILDIKKQMDDGRTQLDRALNTIGAGQKSLADGYQQLQEKGDELDAEKKSLLQTRRALEQLQKELHLLDDKVTRYQSLFDRARALRAQLHSYVNPVDNEDSDTLLQRAKSAWAQQQAENERAEQLRRVTGCLMLAAAIFGLLSTLGIFEKPRLPLPWLPLLLALLLSAAGEAISLSMGRGLWYSTLTLPVFCIALLPLAAGKKQERI